MLDKVDDNESRLGLLSNEVLEEKGTWRSFQLRPLIAGVLVIGSLTLITACFSFFHTSLSLPGPTTHVSEPLSSFCPAPETSSLFHAPRHNLWQNLVLSETVAIRSWLHSPGLNLNLTHAANASLTDNFVELIELLPPRKDNALTYLFSNGDLPVKQARVAISWGGHKHPSVRNYVVGPLPLSGETKLEPLDQMYHQPIIPYNARGVNSYDGFFEMLSPWLQDLQPVVYDLFGAYAPGHPNSTLVAAGVGPMSFDGTFRRQWIQWKYDVTGDYLHPLNLFQYVDFSGTDKSQWKTLKIVYNHQIFNTKEEFVETWRNGTLKRLADDVPRGIPEDTWSSRKRRGSRRALDELPGPRSISFSSKPRFQIDAKEQFVSWMGWEFYLGFDRDMGLSLWNVMFLGDRIAYEISPQEALAQYSGNDPHQATTAWLDRYFGMGLNVKELIPSYDCPNTAVYLPSIVHIAQGSISVERAICIFERDEEKPISRHWGWKKGETGAVKAYVLVVRSIVTVGNYDYLFDYTFMLDGSIDVRVSASGYVQGGFYEPLQANHGARINRHSMGTLHTHIINFKVDLDVAGTSNSILSTSSHAVETSHPWLDEDWGGSTGTTYQQQIKREYISNENDSRFKWHDNFQGSYAFVNRDEKNAWGVERGYAIVPGHSPVYHSLVGSKRLLKNANFAKHAMSVTKRKETERTSSSAWNQNLPGKPPVDFDLFFDGESLDQEDLVAWVNVGMHHFTQSEDVPNTRTNIATSSFTIAPQNFHDYNVSIDSSNAILLNPPWALTPGKPDPDNTHWRIEEVVPQPHCVPRELAHEPKALEYKTPTVWDTDGHKKEEGVLATTTGTQRIIGQGPWMMVGGGLALV